MNAGATAASTSRFTSYTVVPAAAPPSPHDALADTPADAARKDAAPSTPAPAANRVAAEEKRMAEEENMMGDNGPIEDGCGECVLENELRDHTGCQAQNDRSGPLNLK